jgi:hypothetical protein
LIVPRRFAGSGLSKSLTGLAFCVFFALYSATPASALAVVSLSTTANCDAVTGMNISGVSARGAIVTDAAGIVIWVGVGGGLRPSAPFEGPTDNSQWTVTDAGGGAILFTPSTLAPQCTPASLTVTAGDINASAPQGGSVTPLSTTYTLTNAGGSAIYPLATPYFAAGTVFFDLTAVPATIGPFSSVNVTVTFSPSASSQSLGAHSATIAFANAAKVSVVTTRTVNLTITAAQPPTLQLSSSAAMTSTGNQGGPFSPSSFTYQLSAPTGPVNYAISGLPSWLTVSTTFGTVAIDSVTVVTFAINPSAIGLPPGTYNASIAFTNTTNGLGNQSVAATLTVNPTSPPPVQANRTWVSALGSDANDCSRTAPCLTFAGAFAKTTAGGEIDALGRGGFGALTITKAITIDGSGLASILYSGTTGITINAGANDAVTLRNLTLDGTGTGLIGMKFNSGASLMVEDCVIMNSAPGAPGLQFSPTAASKLSVQDTVISNNGGGILAQTAAGGSAKVFLLRVQMVGNGAYGLRADGTAAGAGAISVAVTQSQAAHNGTNGIVAVSGPGSAAVTVERSDLSNNAASGVATSGTSATIWVGNSTIEGNQKAANVVSGFLFTYGNNVVSGNTASDGTFSGTAPLR